VSKHINLSSNLANQTKVKDDQPKKKRRTLKGIEAEELLNGKPKINPPSLNKDKKYLDSFRMFKRAHARATKHVLPLYEHKKKSSTDYTLDEFDDTDYLALRGTNGESHAIYTNSGEHLISFFPQHCPLDYKDSINNYLGEFFEGKGVTKPKMEHRYQRPPWYNGKLCGAVSYNVWYDQSSINPLASSQSQGCFNEVEVDSLLKKLELDATMTSAALEVVDKSNWVLNREAVARSKHLNYTHHLTSCVADCYLGKCLVVNALTKPHFDTLDHGFSAITSYGRYTDAEFCFPELS